MNGDVPVPENDAGPRLHLEREKGLPLRLGKTAHIVLAEPRVRNHLGIEPIDGPANIRGIKLELLGFPIVKPFAVLPDGRQAVFSSLRNISDTMRAVSGSSSKRRCPPSLIFFIAARFATHLGKRQQGVPL